MNSFLVLGLRRGSPWRWSPARQGLPLVVLLAGALAACDSGPSESDFRAACMNEGRAGANRALSNAMGINREAFCSCGAKAAQATMPPDARRLMVFEMQGKRQEVAALQAKMSDDDKMAAMRLGLEVFARCAGGG